MIGLQCAWRKREESANGIACKGRDSGDLWRCCLGPVLVYAHGLPCEARPAVWREIQGLRPGQRVREGETIILAVSRLTRSFNGISATNAVRAMYLSRWYTARATRAARRVRAASTARRQRFHACTKASAHLTAPHRTAHAPHSAL
jgi:hypothetical protein